MGASHVRPAARRVAGGLVRQLALLSVLVCAVVLLIPAAPASAGTASTGTLLFYPCTECHPVSVDAAGTPSRPIPITFKGHGIELEGHDVLGKGDAACLVCHEPTTRNPGMLRAVDGTLVDVKTGDISRLCQKCHFQKYDEYVAGIHGKSEVSCVAAGCHDPHSPGYFNVPALPPFLGTGFQVRIFPERAAFTPLPGPPLPPVVFTPAWYGWVALALYALAAVIAGGLIVTTVRGRQHR